MHRMHVSTDEFTGGIPAESLYLSKRAMLQRNITLLRAPARGTGSSDPFHVSQT